MFEEKKRYKEARDACFSCGVVLVMEGGNRAIRFIDMNGSLKLSGLQLTSISHRAGEQTESLQPFP